MRIVPLFAAVRTEQPLYHGEFRKTRPRADRDHAYRRNFAAPEQPTRIMLWMQLIAGLCLALPLGNRVVLAWSGGVFNPSNDNSIDRLQLYVHLPKSPGIGDSLVPDVPHSVRLPCRRSWTDPVSSITALLIK